MGKREFEIYIAREKIKFGFFLSGCVIGLIVVFLIEIPIIWLGLFAFTLIFLLVRYGWWNYLHLRHLTKIAKEV